MPRDGGPARARLRDAALELYLERGFDGTTTAQIAERAGVTERTFFRHFPDKREVLFDGESELRQVMGEAIAGAPAEHGPLGLVVDAFNAAVPLFVRGRPIAERRAAVIDATPALRERAHAKTVALGDAVVRALELRGIDGRRARLAAQVGSAAFERAERDWDGGSGADLERLIRRAIEEVRAL